MKSPRTPTLTFLQDNVLDKVFSLYLEPLPDLANLSRAHSMALDTGLTLTGTLAH